MGRGYWTATYIAPGGHSRFATSLIQNFGDTQSDFVALQVLNPATFTGTSYERATDTFKLTGTDMSSLGEVGTDIKGFIDWTKFGYDTNADGVADVTFAQGDIASAKVTSDTGLTVVLNSAKAAALETADGFDSTSAAVGNADKLILATNAANTYSNAANVSVRQSLAGQLTIDLGNDGKLVAGVQVEGKWYYHWDRSGDGTIANLGSLNGGGDTSNHDTLDGIFTQTLAELNAGITGTGTNTTDTIRYATLNGVQVALPTYGGPLDGSGNAAPPQEDLNGTAVSDTTTNNPTYNDMLAIWDAHNGAGTSTGYRGTPTDWVNDSYWSASRSSLGHIRVGLSIGNAVNLADESWRAHYVALQVLPIVIDLNHDGALSYGNVVMDVNGDGQLDATRWAGAQDGVLVWDKYHDGQVHDHSQYAFAQYDTTSAAKGQTATDLSGLADAFDSNHDGVFDAQDAQFADFSVWQDANQNGVSDAGEVKTLAELGLASFSLSSDGVARTPVAGVHEAGHTSALTVDGTHVLVADVGFEFTTLATQNGHTYAVWHNSTAQALIDQQMMTAGCVL